MLATSLLVIIIGFITVVITWPSGHIGPPRSDPTALTPAPALTSPPESPASESERKNAADPHDPMNPAPPAEPALPGDQDPQASALGDATSPSATAVPHDVPETRPLSGESSPAVKPSMTKKASLPKPPRKAPLEVPLERRWIQTR
jgi:hypothetical protein